MIELEGEELASLSLGHTDTDNTTCLHVPSIGLVVGGDAAYNDVHVYLGESSAETRKEWISALDIIESLKPCAVVAGHKRSGSEDSPRIVEETRQAGTLSRSIEPWSIVELSAGSKELRVEAFGQLL